MPRIVLANGDAAWRLLNPGRNQSSKLYEVAEVLLTQAPVIYTRAMTSDDLRNMKTRTILPMLESPCNEYAKRYMPHGVPRADEHFEGHGGADLRRHGGD